MLVKQLSREEILLLANRVNKSVVETLGLHNEIKTGLARANAKPEIQKKLSEV